MQIKNFLPKPLSPPTTPLTETFVTLGSFPKASPTKIRNSCCFKCHCQRKPGRAHGSRLADSFQIPTTDNLPHMIKIFLFKRIGLCPITLTTPLVFGFKICMRTPCQIWGNFCKLLYLAYLLPVFSVNLSIYVNYLRLDTFLFT